MKINKADEMEMAINYKSARNAYLFVTISLMAWILYELLQNDELPFIQFAIFSIQNFIFFSSKQYLTKKMTDDSDEK